MVDLVHAHEVLATLKVAKDLLNSTRRELDEGDGEAFSEWDTRDFRKYLRTTCRAVEDLHYSWLCRVHGDPTEAGE